MDTIFVMVNGLPGNMARKTAGFALKDKRFQLVPFSLTGPDINDPEVVIDENVIELVRPENAEKALDDIQERFNPIIVDYTHPDAAVNNVSLYVKHRIPFVLGTTGGDREALFKLVEQGTVPAVIAPNMAKQIVGLQAMFEYGAKTFPGLFEGYELKVKESHQKQKADTSGTAKAMVQYFNELGMKFDMDDIELERDPIRQENIWKIPTEHLEGHGWHTYTLESDDGSSFFQITHNVNGRDIYVKGTFDAVVFLHKKLKSLEKHDTLVYTMIDVLKQNR